jgi:peptidylprolyl isomerase
MSRRKSPSGKVVAFDRMRYSSAYRFWIHAIQPESAVQGSLQSDDSFLCEPEAKSKEIILETVENGKYVTVEYTGKLGNGDVFDSSEGRQPLEVHMGAGEMIKGFESQLLGMAVNDKKVFTISPEDAYGQKNPSLTQSVPRAEVPPQMEVQVGMVIGLMTQQGERIPARITELTDENIILDLNHPLAGESLTFEIEVVGISDEPTQECGDCCSCGHSDGCGD